MHLTMAFEVKAVSNVQGPGHMKRLMTNYLSIVYHLNLIIPSSHYLTY